jgi:hypothetical protein
MTTKPWYARLLNLPEPAQLAEPAAKETATHIVVGHETQSTSQGVSGTEKFGGVFTEDYFRQLQGTRKATEYDKMRRGDARVKMCLSAVKSMLRSADWHFQPADSEETSKTHADFLNFIFKEDIGVNHKKDFKTLLNEVFTMCDFGFTIFERVHKTATTPKFGTYVGYAALGWRHPKTIEYWHTDPNGELLTVEQQAQGDVRKTVKMDAKFLSIITMDKEGDNYEGISLLRPCYGAWSRKQMYLKLMAIGSERMAIPTPKVKVPQGQENSENMARMIEVLERLTSHQSNYVTYPEGWDMDFLIANFDAEKMKSLVQFENEEMTFAFLANFLLLGAGGNSGAFALSTDLSDFFTRSILYIADLAIDQFNKMGRELIDLNFGPQEKYPKMVAQGIVDEMSEGFGTLIKNLTDSKHITPDDDLENELRRRMKIMPMREADMGKRDKPAPTPPAPGAPPAPNPDPDDETVDETEVEETAKLSDFQVRRIALAESKAQQKIGSAQDRVRGVMKKHLRTAARGIVDSIIKNFKAMPEAQQIDATNGVSAKGLKAYQAELRQELVDIAFESIESARREVPKAKKAQLAEFEDLPRSVQKYLQMQSKLLASTTYADLEKVTFLQYGDSLVSTDSAGTIEQDLLEAAETFVEGPSVAAAGGNAGSRVVNEARSAFFFDDAVLEEIESFTFVNGDPVSPICQSLAGQTFGKNDFEAQRLMPPLHHNCKSYVVPNLVGDKNNPEITGLNTKFTPSL